jgi:hypothetical protein
MNCELMLTYDTPALRQTGSRNLMVGFYTHWTYMHIFHYIFLSNYWWQRSDIWSQASYRYPILWGAFLDPSDSYFLFADLVGFYTLLTYDTPALWETGSRNLTGQKTLPTIWGTYMKHMTKYQISAINSCWEKCDEPTSCLPTLLIFIHIDHYMLIFRCIFLSHYWWQKSDIWSHASYRYPIS